MTNDLNPPQPPFNQTEDLYRRLKRWWVDGPIVLGEAIRFAQTSVDRAHYSTPQQALGRGQPDEGIGGVEVARCQLTFPHPNGPPAGSITVSVVHCPELNNFAHCEIRTGQIGSPKPFREPPGTLKAQIRDDLVANMRVVIPPP